MPDDSATTPGFLSALHFDNRFVRMLPGDTISQNYRRQVRGACYSHVKPTPVRAPQLIAWSSDMARELDLPQSPGSDERAELAAVFGGNRLIDGMQPYAMCYGGHQFGNWAGQLGDGRAINLGEVVTRTNSRWVLQLKGAGPTPYSRTADGLAVLRSSVREFLCSEAMHHLGVPTTRALSLVLTGEQVVRDMFYDGNPRQEPGAIVCRVAPTFTRFGNFQILAARHEHDILLRLVDHTIATDYPWLGEPGDTVREKWFQEVCQRTATMIVHWMRVGFVHGVMNTDNMSILGQTIDYGPYGWLEDFDPGWTPNTTDSEGRRYCFGAQPQIALWNVSQLANALLPIFGRQDPLKEGINTFVTTYNDGTRRMLANKLGINLEDASSIHALDELTQGVQELMLKEETDMTEFYRALARIDLRLSNEQITEDHISEWRETLSSALYHPERINDEYRQSLTEWVLQYRTTVRELGLTDEMRCTRMNSVNPRFVLRNYLAQLAIDRAEQGDVSLIEELLHVLKTPYAEQPEKGHLAAKRPDWARNRPGCSMLSCSS